MEKMDITDLFCDIAEVLTLHEVTKKFINRLCGSRVIDIIFHIPRDYIDRSKDLSSARVGEYATFIAQVHSYEFYKKPYRVITHADSKQLTLLFFNLTMPVLKAMLPLNSKVVISGKLELFGGALSMTHPNYIEKNLSKMSEIKKIMAAYPLNRGVANKTLIRIMTKVLNQIPDLPEWITPQIMQEKEWYSWKESVLLVHSPSSLAEADKCRARLAFDELLSHQLALQRLRNTNVKDQGHPLTIKNIYRQSVLQALGFQLTDNQLQVIDEIANDQTSSHKMVRLLQGDVGSGKTAVALFAILNVVENSRQAAFMVPTELLSEQHYQWFQKVLAHTGIKVALLTGKTKQSQRKIILSDIATGACQVVIGTHALFQEKVVFQDLGLVVIDEQQRFGVMQRMKLIEKGDRTDVLLMTATPIPRTLEQALYGDMDCSKLSEKPKCRLPIITTLLNIDKVPEVIDRLKTAIGQGEKVYWLCPYIEDSEESEIAAVEKRFAVIKKAIEESAMVHGKLKVEERDCAMLAFRAGEVKILVATTVIEVGIDVPDATIIVIENAEQFGLSQLHQLRGRVGRSDKQSFCILLHQFTNKTAYRKLQVMKDSQDGFYISEQDLLLRGSGDAAGVKQSGNKDFKFADIFKDQQLVNLAYHQAKIQNYSSLSKEHNLLLKLFNYEDLVGKV